MRSTLDEYKKSADNTRVHLKDLGLKKQKYQFNTPEDLEKENNKNYTAIDLQVEGWAFNITGVWECQEDKGEYFIS